MSRYTDLSTTKRYLGIDGTAEDALIQECIDRAEGAIDAYARRSFVGTHGTVFASRFEQDRVRQGQAYYLQEDLFSLTALTLGDGRSVPVGSVWLEPRKGPPYRIVRLKSAYVYTWNTDQDMILVGTWGHGTVAPLDVQQATIRLASYYYRGKDTANTEVAGNDTLGAQTIPRGLPLDVLDILKKYRSRTGGAA